MTERYEIDQKNPIGVGAYGTVYKCSISSQFYDYLKSKRIALPIDSQNKLFALKFQAYDTMYFEHISILREIDVLMRTKNYPGTVEIFDFWLKESTKQAFLILKLAQMSLDDHINAEPNPFKRLEELPYFTAQMLLHLSFLKHNSIAHRDIKPQNILLAPAPNLFGWSIPAEHVTKPNTETAPQTKVPRTNSKGALFGGTCFSIECLKLAESDVVAPVTQMCKFFQPMAHNCTCFTSDNEPEENSSIKPNIILEHTPTVKNYTCDENISKRTRRPKVAEESKTIPIKNLITRTQGVGSAPSTASLRRMCDDDDNQMQTDNETTTPLCAQSKTEILHRAISIPLMQICDFGLSKHINKTHHSPFIVTPNFRSPEIFDPLSFQNQNFYFTTAGDEGESAKKQSTVTNARNQMRNSLQMSADSVSSSDPNDVSLKRDEDLAYSENIDVWGLGCTIAQIVTGKILFQGGDLSSILNSLRSLLAESYDSSRKNSMSDFEDIMVNDSRCNSLTMDNDLMFDVEDTVVTASTVKKPDPRFLRASLSASSTNVNTTAVWIESVEKRAERLKHKIYAQLTSIETPNVNETTAQRVLDTLGDDFFDLLAQMLDPNPNTRPEAEHLLTHKFVQPFVESSLLLIYSVAYDKFRQVPRQQLTPVDIDYHWWCFQHGLRAGAFQKNQLVALSAHHHSLILYFRTALFSWMLQVIREKNCRYQTLFAAMYNFDRCIANFPRNSAAKILTVFENYIILAVCCLYLVTRYYERIYITIPTLLKGLQTKLTLPDTDFLQLRVTEAQVEKFMSLFINSVAGQITLPSPWHFVLFAFKQMCCNKQPEFATIEQYREVVSHLFGGTGQKQQQRARIAAERNQHYSAEQRQLFTHLRQIRIANTDNLVQQLRSDTRLSNSVYTSNFKKHCSRLLFLAIQSHGLLYTMSNNRSLGFAIFRRCLFNSLYSSAFSRLKLKRTTSSLQQGINMKTTLVRAR